MLLQPAKLNQVINALGVNVKWRAARPCPCGASGQPEFDCPFCYGLGYIWATTATSCVVGQCGRQAQMQWRDMGQYASGDMVVSIPSDSAAYGLGPFDRLLAESSTEPFSMVITRINSGRLGSILQSVVSISEASWIVSGALIEATPALAVADDGTVSIAWGDSAPPAGANYTLVGRRHPEYFCYTEQPVDRGLQAGGAFPRKVVLRRFDLFNRGQ